MASKKFADLFREATTKDEYWVEKAILEFTSDLYAEMKKQGKSKSDLAAILGTSPAYITKVFSGYANFTIETMVKLSRALGCRLHLRVAHNDYKVCWINVPMKRDHSIPPTPCAAIPDSYPTEGFDYASTSFAA